jgi:hypothetical protein
MRKVIFAILLAFTTLYTAHAQQIEWGKTNQSKSKKFTPVIKHWNDDGLYTIAHSYNYNFNYKIGHYDFDSLKCTINKEIELPEINRHRTSLERITFLNGKFIVFCSYFDRKADKTMIYAYSIDSKTGHESEKKIKLLEIPVEKKRRQGKFYVIISKDKSKILVNHEAYYKKERLKRDTYVLFNEELEILLKRNDEIENQEINYSSSGFVIDNDGSVFFMKHYNDGRTFIASYDSNTDYEKWEEQIRLDDIAATHKVKNITVSFNTKDNLILTGYVWSDENMEGIFFMEMDRLSKEVITSRYNPFEVEFKLEVNNTDNSYIYEKKMNYNITNHLHQENGNTILIGEYYNKRIQYGDFHTSVYTTHADLLITNISASGEIVWCKRLPKIQHNYSTVWVFRSMQSVYKELEHYSSMYGLSGSKLYVTYNDHPENLNKLDRIDDLKKMRNHKKSITTLVTIDLENGETKKEKLEGVVEDKLVVKPYIYKYDYSKKEMVVFAQKGRKYKFGIIKLPTEPSPKQLSYR